MSIQQPRQNFNETRMVQRAYEAIEQQIHRFKRNVKNRHASVVLEDKFWKTIQQTLIIQTDKRRQLLAAGQYTDGAEELRSLTMFAIRTAVEQFRERALNDPYCIHTDDAWEQFYTDIRHYANQF